MFEAAEAYARKCLRELAQSIETVGRNLELLDEKP
jgi:hypothetical protein